MSSVDSDLVEKIAIAQLIVIVIFGFLYCEFIRYRCKNLESLRIFRYGQYSSQMLEDPKIMFRSVPRWFRFVVVRYSGSGQVISESFYTFLGDETTIKFPDGEYFGCDYNPTSNIVFVVAVFIAIILLLPSNFIAESSILHSLFSSSREMWQQFAQYGLAVFFSIFIAAPIKIIFDYANHLKKPIQ